MKLYRNSLIICGSFFALLAMLVALTFGRDALSLIGLTGIGLSVLYLLLGAVLCIPESSREVGKALLTASGIILIIGLGVCSAFPINMAH